MERDNCERCGAPLSEPDIAGGRCHNCGTMIVAKPTKLVILEDDEPVILKAHGGDRAANLESIADKIDTMLDVVEDQPRRPINLDAQAVHTIAGYMEQLRIIADEIRGNRK